MAGEKVNLFVYGSLRDRRVFKSVCGLSFSLRYATKGTSALFAEPAFLDGYRKVSPDNVYFYAVANLGSRIEGYLIHNVAAQAIAEIDRYEGGRYDRETITVNTAHGPVRAYAYLTSHEKMRKHFGDRFHVNLIQELWLRKRIEEFIRSHTRPGERSVDAWIERRAQRELLAATERDLVITHYRSDSVSDFYLAHELDRPRPSIRQLLDEPEARPYLANYLKLVVKQVLLNQLDEKVQARYRFELEHLHPSERYFKRTFSLLIAFRLLNPNSEAVKLVLHRCLEMMPPGKYDLIDYVKYAVKASDSLFVPQLAEERLKWIRENLQGGIIPLGAEIELSNLGFKAVAPAGGTAGPVGRDSGSSTDPLYHGFKYFSDFQLGVLTWKVGGYVDDHTDATSAPRRQGFLELAPGRLSIEGELSRPATADPWALNQLIHEITTFYEVAPHSLHLSFQLLKKQLGRQQILPLDFVKCLFVLGGGLEQKALGRLWVSRLDHDEITQDRGGIELVFARTSKRKWYQSPDDLAIRTPPHVSSCVQQYKFIRLDNRANYEPLILGLKGLQLAYNPADYLTAEQLRASSALRADFQNLKSWALDPAPINESSIDSFLATVQEGLSRERVHKPVHKPHYIDWALSAIDVRLRMFNQQLEKNAG
jgi:gamma-glutamylcyclotransferase (GGCT)/AIG2-like uncharacterized protein YtfP